MFHFTSPQEKTPKIAALAPEEFPELQEPDLLHLDPAVGFNPPQQVWAAPWSQSMAASGIPQKSKHVAHCIQYSRPRMSATEQMLELS